MSVSLVSSVTSASSVLERDVGLSLTILDERSFEFGREVFRNSGFNIGEQGLVSCSLWWREFDVVSIT
ncbi:hypothetical protein F2Q68_00016598 [Brassica cretica]|uniref:Uncharacterized protein n=1 Tax=Brassica cretica TaxID=69181 RepID=A0A8S9HY25_BRACR|nr:hypothetical protein F2Q68_00016598 [Brassica cretica]